MRNFQSQLLILLCCLVATLVQGQSTCLKSDEGGDSFVCLCYDTVRCDFPGQIDYPTTAGQFSRVVSDRDTSRFDVTADLSATSGVASTATVSVNFAQRKQDIMGFGGSFTDAAGLQVNDMGPGFDQLFIDTYFSSNGIEYNLCRTPIAGSDFSTRPYSYDETVNDTDLVDFALPMEDTVYKIPYIKLAKDVTTEELWLFGSPWSPPYWMKTNGKYNESGRLLDEFRQTYADYFVRFIEEYESLTELPIWGLTPQNEPPTGLFLDPEWAWNTCGFDEVELKDFIRDYLGPTLESRNYSRVNIMNYDFNRNDLERYALAGINDPEASKYIAGNAVHWYDDRYIGPESMDTVHDADPSKFLLYTEGCMGWEAGDTGVSLGNWTRAEIYGTSIIENLNHWSTGWVDWNMALGTDGGPNWAGNLVDAPIIADQDNGRYMKQPSFYVLGHFSKFVKRGSTVVNVTSVTDVDLMATAVENTDGTATYVLMNFADTTKNVTIQNSNFGGSDSYLTFQMTPKSIESILYTPF